MREIRFRGKRVDNGEWIYGYYSELPFASFPVIAQGEDSYCEDTRPFIITIKSFQHPNFSNAYPLQVCDKEVFEVLPETIGQWTGLKDKNGVEVYEGDVVETEGSELFPSERFTIEYIKGSFCLIGKDGKGFEIWRQCNYSGGVDTGRTWCEVIRDIHSNPSLLEVPQR